MRTACLEHHHTQDTARLSSLTRPDSDLCPHPPPSPLARTTPLSEQQQVLFPSNFGIFSVVLARGRAGYTLSAPLASSPSSSGAGQPKIHGACAHGVFIWDWDAGGIRFVLELRSLGLCCVE